MVFSKILDVLGQLEDSYIFSGPMRDQYLWGSLNTLRVIHNQITQNSF